MELIYKHLVEWLNKYLSYLSFTAITAALGFLAKYLIQRKIDTYFNNKLEKYRQELNLLTEQVKYDLNKRMFDFQAYATKKHEVYPELYRKLVASLFLIQQYLSMKNSADISTLVERQTEIVQNHERNVQYYAEVELYLSEEVSEKTKTVLVLTTNYLYDLFDEWCDTGEIMAGIRNIHERLTDLKKLLHKELSYSHFGE